MIKVRQIKFLVRALFLCFGQPPSGCILTWPFLGCLQGKRENQRTKHKSTRAPQLSDVSSYKNTNPVGSRPRPYDLL